MDAASEILRKIEEVELVGEELLLARRQLVDSDRMRNGNREALTALRKQARTSRSSVFDRDQQAAPQCSTCGDSDGSRPVWNFCPGADVFIRLPFHQVHGNLENAQASLDTQVKVLQSTVKEQAFSLSEKEAIADIVSPSMMESFVTLKG